ncbi:MAG: MFS transporter [Rhodospirillales bacterium]|nr:MFS transporter [Rhodospirillales bacterium]
MRTGNSIAAAIGTLIIATSAVQLANGFFTTFISLRVVSEGFEAGLAGLILSSYFAGFTWGESVRTGSSPGRPHSRLCLLRWPGCAATVMMPLKVDPYAWIALRAVIGFGCAGIFVTTESWLNAKAAPEIRGRVFAIYMVGTFLALAAGQLLIGRIDVQSAGPFNAIVALFAFGLVLVSSTRAEPPKVTPTAAPPYRELLRAAPIAVLGCILSGLITGTFYALVPAYMQSTEISTETIAWFMFAAVVGGLVFQVPVGRLSDHFDRRRVLAALGLGLAAFAVAIVFLPRSLAIVLPAAAILGGFMSTLYPVCVAHAHDRMPADRVVAVSGALILISGIGSVLGPLIGTPLMIRLDIDGVFYLIAAAAALFAVITILRSRVVEVLPCQERTFEVLTPQAATLAHDPGEAAKESEPAAMADESAGYGGGQSQSQPQ